MIEVLKGGIQMVSRYSITEMAELLNQNKENIRRFVKRNDIKEINVDRPHPNSPKFYDESAFKIIQKEYTRSKVDKKDKHNSGTTKVNKSTTNAQHEYDRSNSEVVQLLKSQIERLEKDKDELKDHQSKLTKMLEQQQHLTLIAQKQADTLKIELNEVIEPDKVKDSFFNRIFNRNK